MCAPCPTVGVRHALNLRSTTAKPTGPVRKDAFQLVATRAGGKGSIGICSNPVPTERGVRSAWATIAGPARPAQATQTAELLHLLLTHTAPGRATRRRTVGTILEVHPCVALKKRQGEACATRAPRNRHLLRCPAARRRAEHTWEMSGTFLRSHQRVQGPTQTRHETPGQ